MQAVAMLACMDDYNEYGIDVVVDRLAYMKRAYP